MRMSHELTQVVYQTQLDNARMQRLFQIELCAVALNEFLQLVRMPGKPLAS